MITLSIDLKKLDKARFKKVTRQNGEEALFCDLVMFDTPDSEYGDYAIKQSVTKEEREAKLQMPFVGNAKKIGQKPAGGQSRSNTRPAREESPDDPGW